VLAFLFAGFSLCRSSIMSVSMPKAWTTHEARAQQLPDDHAKSTHDTPPLLLFRVYYGESAML